MRSTTSFFKRPRDPKGPVRTPWDKWSQKQGRAIEDGIKKKLDDLFKPPQKKPEPMPVPNPETGGQPEQTRPRRRNDDCCIPDKFLENWPVNRKNASYSPEIGWNDWNKEYDGKKIQPQQVIFNRGFKFQLEVTESLCDGLEFLCKDNAGAIGSRHQWADGLNWPNCNMVEVKYAMHETTYTKEKAYDLTNPPVRRLHEQFKRYAIICNNPRKVSELPCLAQVGLEIFVNWNTMVEFYEEIMSIYSIPGPKPQQRLPRYYYGSDLADHNTPNGIESWMDEAGSDI
ncbi:hypothetical protein [Roseibium sediminis]|uniref:hypothetical protein n=1 Tax=Roseibium sediminis TaxID=1775174 RepID=UPI00123D609D|nr:hypothetical protein [Roseibium sediminis]